MRKTIITSFIKERAGAVLILVAVALPVVIGIAGLAIEAGLWYAARGRLKNLADAAAIGGAIELSKEGSAGLLQSVQADLSANKFTVGDGNTMAVNNPPQSGAYTSDGNAVEVILSQEIPLLLSSLFLSSPVTVSARGVATSSASSFCVAVLDPTGNGALTISGNGSLTTSGCSVGVNSSNASALALSGNAKLAADSVSVVGNYTHSGSSEINVTGGVRTGVSPLADPYASLQIPSYSGCTATNFSTKTSQTLSPGVYCGGMSLSSKASVTLNPGTYIIDGGELSLSGQASIQGTGVTIVLTSSSGTNYATVSVGSGSNVNLTAPSSGTLSGIAFFQDRNAPSTGINDFTAGSTLAINGALYFPNQTLLYSGHASQSTSVCSQLVARRISISGSAKGGFTCPFPTNQSGTVKLVE